MLGGWSGGCCSASCSPPVLRVPEAVATSALLSQARERAADQPAPPQAAAPVLFLPFLPRSVSLTPVSHPRSPRAHEVRSCGVVASNSRPTVCTNKQGPRWAGVWHMCQISAQECVCATAGDHRAVGGSLVIFLVRGRASTRAQPRKDTLTAHEPPRASPLLGFSIGPPTPLLMRLACPP